MPGQQLVETGDLVIGDPAEDIGQPGLEGDAVHPGGFDERIPAKAAAKMREAGTRHWPELRKKALARKN